MDVAHLLSPPESMPRDTFSAMHDSPASPHYLQMSDVRHSTPPPSSSQQSNNHTGYPSQSPTLLPGVAQMMGSPPLAPTDRHGHGHGHEKKHMAEETTMKQHRLLSPPVTPGRLAQVQHSSPLESHRVVDDGNDSRDPILFPHQVRRGSSAATEPEPLFTLPQQQQQQSRTTEAYGRPHLEPMEPEVDPHKDALIQQHMESRTLPSLAKPTRTEYSSFLNSLPIVYGKYHHSPNRWLRQETKILNDRFPNAGRAWRYPAHAAPLPRLAPAPSVNGVHKTHAIRNATPVRRLPPGSRVIRTPAQRTPRARVYDNFNMNGITPSPKRVVAPSREDVEFDALPDYAPSLDTLPANNSKVLKAEWKGQGLDLSTDPNRHLLHESEVKVAETLRLSCATYLCSKRRIFAARLNALRNGKEFRKTDSQQACKIDVNKASKLWSAYDKVGWFDRRYFEHLL